MNHLRPEESASVRTGATALRAVASTSRAQVIARFSEKRSQHGVCDMAMARLWYDDGGAWTAVTPDAVSRLHPSGDAWVLFGDVAARLNGAALAAGIRVLRDRDEIVVDGWRAFFSTESPPVVAPFGGAAPVACPRCRLDVTPGTPSVACPRCRIVHHESPADELPCWSYAPLCAMCDCETALDAGPRWTPEGL
jgi:hypothetical protein